jgi:hypothetical protein
VGLGSFNRAVVKSKTTQLFTLNKASNISN